MDLDLDDLIEVTDLPRDLLHASALPSQLLTNPPALAHEADFEAEPSLTGTDVSWRNGKVIPLAVRRARWRFRLSIALRRVTRWLRGRRYWALSRIPARRRARARVRMLTPGP